MKTYILIFFSIMAFLLFADFAFNQQYMACLGWFLIWAFLNIKAIATSDRKEKDNA